MRHVDPRSKHAGAVWELAGAHPSKQVEIFRDRSVAERARSARPLEAASRFPNLVHALAVDVCLALANQPDGALVHPLEVVGGDIQVLAPVSSEPAGVAFN